jgi:RND family efflux transporter MFP subunit
LTTAGEHVVIAGSAAAGTWAWKAEPSPLGTSEAFAAEVSDVEHPAGVRAEGRVVAYPGEQVTVGTELGGTIARLHVREGDEVKKGDVLVELDATELRAALEEANAAVHANNARAGFHVKEARRLKVLSASGAVPERELDRARSERNAAFGETAVAMSSVKRIEAALAKTSLLAPIDGTVVSCAVEQGETRPPMAELVTIANLAHLRVVAEVDEFDVARVAMGAKAVMSAEGFDATSDGVVEDVPGALVPKGLKPRDPSRPVDTRVLPVKIGFAGATPLKLGQRVEVRILPGPGKPAHEEETP